MYIVKWLISRKNYRNSSYFNKPLL
jgi:hypothetical protein